MDDTQPNLNLKTIEKRLLVRLKLQFRTETYKWSSKCRLIQFKLSLPKYKDEILSQNDVKKKRLVNTSSQDEIKQLGDFL